MASSPNGWITLAASSLVLITAIGAVFYVAFQGAANYQAILRLEILVEKNQESIRGLKLEMAQQQQALGEIETQFCAQDAIRNLMHAQDMRNFSLLWERAFGSKMPTDNTYYPTLCNRQHTGTFAPRP